MAEDNYYLISGEKEGVVYEFILKSGFLRGANAINNYHFHSVYEVHIAIRGEIHLMFEEGKTTLRAGQVCVIPPCKTHYILSDDNSHHIGFRFRIRKEKNREARTVSFCDEVVIKSIDIYEKYIKAAAQNLKNNYPDFMVCDLLILSIFELSDNVAIYKEQNNKLLSDSDSDIIVSEKIEDFLNISYTKNVHLDDLAKHLNLGTRQTQRICMKYFGEAFNVLLNRKRLSIAKYLLKNTKLSVDEISRMSGFENSNYFYRKFSSSYNVTPGEYRRK